MQAQEAPPERKVLAWVRLVSQPFVMFKEGAVSENLGLWQLDQEIWVNLLTTSSLKLLICQRE